MLPDIASVITKDAIELKKLDQTIVRLILEWNTEDLFQKVQEFIDLRKNIRKNLIEHDTVKIFDHKAQEVRH